jgi:probable HAF family extracellular repeat protein
VASNNLGQAVGSTEDVSTFYNPSQPAPAWQGSPPGVGRLVDVTGSLIAEATAINDRGQIIGWAQSPSVQPDNSDPQNPKFEGTTFIPMPDLIRSKPSALNNAGQVVGYFEIAGSGHLLHAFLYDSGTTYDLNDLIPNASGITLNYTGGIDEAGRIVGFGTDGSGASRAYLLTPATPVPEPTTLALLGLIATSAGARLVIRRCRARATSNV